MTSIQNLQITNVEQTAKSSRLDLHELGKKYGAVLEFKRQILFVKVELSMSYLL